MNNETALVSPFSFARVSVKALQPTNFLQSKRLAAEFEPFTAPFTSDEPEPALALGQSTVPAPWLSYEDRGAQYNSSGWMNRGRTYRSEGLTATAAPTKEYLICHEFCHSSWCCSKVNYPNTGPEQGIASYESIFCRKSYCTSCFFWRSKQLFGAQEQDQSAGSTAATPNSSLQQKLSRETKRWRAIINPSTLRQSLATYKP